MANDTVASPSLFRRDMAANYLPSRIKGNTIPSLFSLLKTPYRLTLLGSLFPPSTGYRVVRVGLPAVITHAGPAFWRDALSVSLLLFPTLV
jgi:hypothetical protein